MGQHFVGAHPGFKQQVSAQLGNCLIALPGSTERTAARALDVVAGIDNPVFTGEDALESGLSLDMSISRFWASIILLMLQTSCNLPAGWSQIFCLLIVVATLKCSHVYEGVWRPDVKRQVSICFSTECHGKCFSCRQALYDFSILVLDHLQYHSVMSFSSICLIACRCIGQKG